MNTEPTINLMETDRLLCNACYQDIQHEALGDIDPNTWLHSIIPWQLDDICSCCQAEHPERRSSSGLLTQSPWAFRS